MTGFGRGHVALGGGRIVVELRTLNHRYQDLRISIPPELFELEEEVDRQLRSTFPRGRIELSARLQGKRAVELRLDRDLARTCLTELESLREELGLSEQVSVNVLAAVPEIFIQEPSSNVEGAREALFSALRQAIDAAETMRTTEAKALTRDLENRLDHLAEMVALIGKTASSSSIQAQARLKARLNRLLESEGLQLDDVRLAQEVAIIADRSDIAEELTRFASHIKQFRKITGESGPVGRRLDFLLQEMHREASTMGAKSQDAKLQHLNVDVKAEINRMREQIQNIE